MHRNIRMRLFASAAALALVTSCTATGPVIQSPEIALTGVQVEGLNLNGQSFLLAFSVSNPNPFPLPIRAIRYDLKLEDRKFASGQAQSDFMVAARGDGDFVISVELDLLQSVSQAASLFKAGTRDSLAYSIEGSVNVDIPFTRPVPFSNTGVVRLRNY